MTPGPALPAPIADASLMLLTQKFGLILSRTAGLLSLFPLGAEIVPARIRVVAAVALAATLLPVVPEPPAGLFVLQICAEGAVGVLAALLARVPLAVIEAGMQITSVSAGLGIASLLDPSTDEEVHALTELFTYASLCLFFSLGGHHRLILALHESLLRVPPGGARISLDVLGLVLRLGADVFSLAVQVAAPVLVVSLALNLTLALVARAAPAVNIFSVTLVAVLLGGMFAILRGAPVIFAAMRRAVDATPAYYLLGFQP
jgi:flagellar biosynthesis protein FliR